MVSYSVRSGTVVGSKWGKEKSLDWLREMSGRSTVDKKSEFSGKSLFHQTDSFKTSICWYRASNTSFLLHHRFPKFIIYYLFIKYTFDSDCNNIVIIWKWIWLMKLMNEQMLTAPPLILIWDLNTRCPTLLIYYICRFNIGVISNSFFISINIIFIISDMYFYFYIFNKSRGHVVNINQHKMYKSINKQYQSVQVQIVLSILLLIYDVFLCIIQQN